MGGASTENEDRVRNETVSPGTAKQPKTRRHQRYYVVTSGRQTGIYDDWIECDRQVNGYSNCNFRGTETFAEARECLSAAGIPFSDQRTRHSSESVAAVKKNHATTASEPTFSDDTEISFSLRTPSAGQKVLRTKQKKKCRCSDLSDQVIQLTALVHKLQEQITGLELNQTSPARGQPSEQPTHGTIPSYSSAAKTPAKTVVRHAAPPPPASPFDPEKNVVLTDFVDMSLRTDLKIRAMIGKLNTTPPPLITGVNLFNPRNPSAMVQLQTPEMAKKVLEEWKSDKVAARSPRARTESFVGMAISVPCDIPEEELKSALEIAYSGTTVRRLRNRDGPLKTVRIEFKDHDDLSAAVKNGLTLADYCLRVSIQEARPPIQRPTQCYKCFKFNHIAKYCNSDSELCSNCGMAGHRKIDCAGPAKCINCLQAHSSDNRECPVYVRRLHQLSAQRDGRQE